MGKLSILPQQDSLEKNSLVKRLDLKVGYKCSNDCLFCVVADKRPLGELSTEKIFLALLESFREGRRELVLTGGEVTIREDIFDIVSYAKKLGYKEIQIQTNGRRFASMEFTKKMIQAGMTTFAPALHGPTAAIHDGLTRSRDSWRQTVLGIHNVARLGIKTLTNTVVTKQNYRHLPEIAELLVKLGAIQFQFAFVHIQGNAFAYYKKVVPSISSAAVFIKKGLDVGIREGRRCMVEAVPFCLLEGYEQFASEFFIPAAQIREIHQKIDNFDIVRKLEAKIKFPSCMECSWYQKCEGPWEEYPRLFGTNEFKPVKKKVKKNENKGQKKLGCYTV